MNKITFEHFSSGEILPVLPLRNVVLLPKTVIPIVIGRNISLKAIEAALKDKKEILVVAQRDAEIEIPAKVDLFSWGTRATVIQVAEMSKGMMKILLEGICRVKINRLDRIKGEFFMGEYEDYPTELDNGIETNALWRHLRGLYKIYAKLNPKVPEEIIDEIQTLSEMDRAVDSIAVNSNLNTHERQEILELVDLKKRMMKLATMVQREISILEAEERIRGRVQTQVEEKQREYFLNEQMKAIQRELGTEGNDKSDVEILKEKTEEIELSEEAHEKVMREINRLEQMPPLSAEATVSRNYVEWILSLPWEESSDDTIGLKEAQRILDQDHAGLQKPKERIIEFMAAKKFSPSLKRSPIICLVGPPGVGKTSLGKSIARALNRKFIRISLGGTRDEAEIRGHRRTYIGSLPGKIIQAMRKAGTMNPVIMFDEVDKMSSDAHGDPASALLEVLDPEQNCKFVDNFLEIEYDLSQVMFITTANHHEGVPYPLLNRMEMIRLSGYTTQEKLEIAQKFLIPKNLEENSLTTLQCKIPKSTIAYIISSYTKEAGVRQLERTIVRILRKVIQKFLSYKSLKSVIITKKMCQQWLGNPIFKKKTVENNKNQVGYATGLAWTELGGDILEIETTAVPGKGELTLTGQLGDVMRESAQTALSYVRSRTKELGIKKEFYPSHDIHIHVPEGATPKDGPSAGITICTALVSALTNNPIKPSVAMSGEITLRGRVLPVGGLKEKILAAHQHGIKKLVLPKDNKEDVAKIKEEIKEDIKIDFVHTMDEVLKKTLSNNPFGNRSV